MSDNWMAQIDNVVVTAGHKAGLPSRVVKGSDGDGWSWRWSEDFGDSTTLHQSIAQVQFRLREEPELKEFNIEISAAAWMAKAPRSAWGGICFAQIAPLERIKVVPIQSQLSAAWNRAKDMAAHLPEAKKRKQDVWNQLKAKGIEFLQP